MIGKNSVMAKVLEKLLLGGADSSPHYVQRLKPPSGPLGPNLLKDPQDQRPHYAHIWAHPLQVLMKVGAGN